MSPLVLQQDSSCDLLFGKDEEGLSDEEWLSSSCCDQGLPCCDQEGLSCCDQEWLGCCDPGLSVEEGLSLLPGWVFEKVCLASANNVQATRWV